VRFMAIRKMDANVESRPGSSCAVVFQLTMMILNIPLLAVQTSRKLRCERMSIREPCRNPNNELTKDRGNRAKLLPALWRVRLDISGSAVSCTHQSGSVLLGNNAYWSNYNTLDPERNTV
jgi:hypothetical protein